MLTFNETPLAEAIAEANRYSKVQVRLASADLSQLSVSGAYRAGDIDALAKSLAAAFDLQVQTAPDGALILAR